jgi:hypothetical protein
MGLTLTHYMVDRHSGVHAAARDLWSERATRWRSASPGSRLPVADRRSFLEKRFPRLRRPGSPLTTRHRPLPPLLSSDRRREPSSDGVHRQARAPPLGLSGAKGHTTDGRRCTGRRSSRLRMLAATQYRKNRSYSRSSSRRARNTPCPQIHQPRTAELGGSHP